jgi:hypothetical protein
MIQIKEVFTKCMILEVFATKILVCGLSILMAKGKD